MKLCLIADKKATSSKKRRSQIHAATTDSDKTEKASEKTPEDGKKKADEQKKEEEEKKQLEEIALPTTIKYARFADAPLIDLIQLTQQPLIAASASLLERLLKAVRALLILFRPISYQLKNALQIYNVTRELPHNIHTQYADLLAPEPDGDLPLRAEVRSLVKTLIDKACTDEGLGTCCFQLLF